MLSPWKESYDQLNILKSRDITLPTKVCLVKATVWLDQSQIHTVVMYRFESWTIKKAEHWRTDALELRCWRRLLKVPWTAKRSNQSILREINPEYSLEGQMLKLQYFGSSDENTWLIGKFPDAGKDWGQKEKRASKDEMVGWHHWCMNLGKLWEMLKDRETWCVTVDGVRVGHD